MFGRLREWYAWHRLGPARRIRWGDGILRSNCFHHIRLKTPATSYELACTLDQIIPWIADPENGCRGTYFIGFQLRLGFECPRTAMLVKLRWG